LIEIVQSSDWLLELDKLGVLCRGINFIDSLNNCGTKLISKYEMEWTGLEKALAL
jgi:hypothetical protein